jgi:hypothetical protein
VQGSARTWQCGVPLCQGRSLTNRFFYGKLYRRTYKCMTFVFSQPGLVDLFFRRLGNKRNWVISVQITCTKTLADSSLLKNVFVWLSKSNLRNSELTVLPDYGLLDPASQPIYLPSVPEEDFKTGRHDHLLRRLRTSLKCIQFIQLFTFIGHPNRDGGEFQYSESMDERAEQECKIVM